MYCNVKETGENKNLINELTTQSNKQLDSLKKIWKKFIKWTQSNKRELLIRSERFLLLPVLFVTSLTNCFLIVNWKHSIIIIWFCTVLKYDLELTFLFEAAFNWLIGLKKFHLFKNTLKDFNVFVSVVKFMKQFH